MRKKSRNPLPRAVKPAGFLVLAGILILVFAEFYSCSTASREDVRLRDILQSPQKHLENYAFDPRTTLAQRVVPAPSQVLRHLRRLDNRENYESYRPTAAERKVISNALEMLPPLTRKVLQDRLIALYLIDNLFGSGFSDWVVDKSGRVYCIIGINPVTLRMNVSEWLTWKESTAFRRDDSGIRVAVDCGRALSGFLGILLHESAHVVDYVRPITPYVDYSIYAFRKSRGEEARMTGFVSNIWKSAQLPEPSADFADRSQITFYLPETQTILPLSRAPELYGQLDSSPFVSLYGSLSWSEDLAEMVMYRHLTEVLGQDYVITVSMPDGKTAHYRPMAKPQVRKRLAALRLFYH